MDHRRARRSWLALAWTVPLLLGSCSTWSFLAGTRHGAAPPTARRHLARIEGMIQGEDYAGALAELRVVLRNHPWYVQAHRRYQEVRILNLRKGALLVEYEDLLAAHPQRAEAHYLRGRLEGDLDRQARYFKRAIELDAGLPWGFYGLAVVSLQRGDPATAERLLGEALKLDPLQGDFLLARADLLRRTGRFESAREAYQRAQMLEPHRADARFAIGRAALASEMGDNRRAFEVLVEALAIAPRRVALYTLLRRMLSERPDAVTPSRVQRALLAAGDAIRRAGLPPGGALVREYHLAAAETARAVGQWEGAVLQYQRALASGMHRFTSLEGRRSAFVHARLYTRALALWKASVPPGLLAHPANELRPRIEELERASAGLEAHLGDGAACLRLARAYRAMGWLEEAHHCASLAQVLDPGEGPAVLRLVREIEGFRGILDRLREEIQAGYRGRGAPSLEALLTELRGAARELLGRDPGASRIDSISFLAKRVDPTVQSGGVPGFFASFGRFLLLGKLLFSPPQAYCMRALHQRALQATVLGRPLEGTVVIGEGRDITSRAEVDGPGVAGAAVHHGYFVNLDLVRAWTRQVELLARRFPSSARREILDDPLPACTPEERTSLGDPLNVSEKLVFRALERSAQGVYQRLFEIVSLHERAHLSDAAEYLPLGDHPLRAFLFLLGEGFSTAGIEARLELRAELAALASAREPDLVLAHIAEYAVSGRSGAHARGFREILERFVARLDGELASFPALRPDRNLFQQLHLLEREEIRRIALELAGEEGLVGSLSSRG